MKIHNKRLTKRLFISTALGTVFGFLCFAGFSSNHNIPAELAKRQVWSLNNVWMWVTVTNRFTLGFIVGIAGFAMRHPILGCKLIPFLRGAGIGFLISFSMALGSLLGENQQAAWGGFWVVLIAGIVIGAIIDFVTTKIAGEGSYLQEGKE